MEKKVYSAQTRWADFDANAHMIHTSYAELCSMIRIRYLDESGLSFSNMHELGVGPVLFKEETVYLREIKMSDAVEVSIEIKGLSENGDRWKIQQEIIRNGEVAGIHNVHGAWIDLKKRKLTASPIAAKAAFENLSKTDDFEILPMNKK
jgi:acyl-CoA thioester hydrolase